MVGTWVGLHDRPVRTALSRATASIAAAARPCCRGRTTTRSNPGPAPQSGPPHEREAPWHPPRLAQDRVPVGQGGQAAVPEDAWWAPTLPGRRDPPAGRRAAGAADGLSGQSLQRSSSTAGLLARLADLGRLGGLTSGRSGGLGAEARERDLGLRQRCCRVAGSAGPQRRIGSLGLLLRTAHGALGYQGSYPRRMMSAACTTMVSPSIWEPTTTVGSTSA